MQLSQIKLMMKLSAVVNELMTDTQANSFYDVYFGRCFLTKTVVNSVCKFLIGRGRHPVVSGRE